MLRRLFRRFFPRLRHPLLDADAAKLPVDAANDVRYRGQLSPEERADPFTAERYAEGMRWRSVVANHVPPPALVLDAGAGNGAIELAFNAAGYRVISVEREWNETARHLDAIRVIGSAAALPFRSAAFDVVLMLETIEHLSDVRDVSAELGRVMRPAAVALLTTPPRWRYALRGDPHFGIRFLTLLPAAFQRRVATSRGYDQPHHYVGRIYSSTAQIIRVMAPLRLQEVLSRSRLPKRWFWDAIVLRKT